MQVDWLTEKDERSQFHCVKHAWRHAPEREGGHNERIQIRSQVEYAFCVRVLPDAGSNEENANSCHDISCNQWVQHTLFWVSCDIFFWKLSKLKRHWASKSWHVKVWRVCSRVLITTDVWARGLDVQQVSLVINYDLPNNRELYIHRYGLETGAVYIGVRIACECIGNCEDMNQLSHDINNHECNIRYSEFPIQPIKNGYCHPFESL